MELLLNLLKILHQTQYHQIHLHLPFLFLLNIFLICHFIMNNSLVELLISEFFISSFINMKCLKACKILSCLSGESNWIEVELLHVIFCFWCSKFHILEIIDVIEVLWCHHEVIWTKLSFLYCLCLFSVLSFVCFWNLKLFWIISRSFLSFFLCFFNNKNYERFLFFFSVWRVNLPYCIVFKSYWNHTFFFSEFWCYKYHFIFLMDI